MRTTFLVPLFSILAATGMLQGIDQPVAEEIAPKTSCQGFTHVAKIGIPAVVSVRGEAPATAQEMNGRNDAQMTLQEEFWSRFFGIPFPGMQQRQQQPTEPEVFQASGFIVSSDGHILTNTHVVDHMNKIFVTLNDGKEYPATVVGSDPNTDIALLKIDATDLPALKFANSDEVEIGQWAIAIGNPLGLQASLTVGVVSAKGRADLDIVPIGEFIQTDASLNPGNSGSPLLDITGNVIGMNTAIMTMTGGSIGVNYAIPSNLIKHILQELQTQGKVTRGYIGVLMQPIDGALSKAFHLEKPEGALVADVMKESPAEKAGLKQGDVLVSINDTHCTTVGQLRNAISLMPIGSTATLGIIRDGEPMTLTAVIENHPDSSATASTIREVLGLTVQELTPDIAEQLGYEAGTPGIVIAKVKPGSAAESARLRRGMVIVSVNGTPVTSAEQFQKAMSAGLASKSIVLLVRAGNDMRFVALCLD